MKIDIYVGLILTVILLIIGFILLNIGWWPVSIAFFFGSFALWVGIYGIRKQKQFFGYMEKMSNKSGDSRHCVKCGKSIPFDANICPYCGHVFN